MTKDFNWYVLPLKMVKGKNVAVKPPATAASMVPRPKVRARIFDGGDAHQLRRGPIIGDGANGLARPGKIEKQVKRSGHNQRGGRREQTRALQDYGPHFDGTQREIHILGRRAEYCGPDADNDHVDGKGAQQGIQVAGLDDPSQRDDIHDDPENQGHDHQQQQADIRVDARMGEQEVDAEHPQGHGGAMRQVDDPHHSPD